MFKLNYLLSAIILLVLISCLPAVIFTEYQPSGASKSSQFPLSYRGDYFCEGDGSIVRIESKLVSKEMMYRIGIDMQEFEQTEGVTFENGELFIEGYQEPFKAFIQNDTLFSDIVLKDTLFNLSNEDHILTEYKGHQIVKHENVLPVDEFSFFACLLWKR